MNYLFRKESADDDKKLLNAWAEREITITQLRDGLCNNNPGLRFNSNNELERWANSIGYYRKEYRL